MLFGSLGNKKITYLEPTYCFGRSGKQFITLLCFKTIVRSKRDKNSRYAIANVIMKDLSNNIKAFEKLPYKGYVWNRPKNERTDS